MTWAHPRWGPRRLLFELARAGVDPVPSRSTVYRVLVRHQLVTATSRKLAAGPLAAVIEFAESCRRRSSDWIASSTDTTCRATSSSAPAQPS
jgi:hypothetical protein